MNAIKMLKQQHREVDKLFKQLAATKTAEPRLKTFVQIADALAIHATIEERHFYPSVKEKQTEDILLESVEEHLEIKRVIADLLQMDADDEEFVAKVTVLQEDVQHHVEEEEGELFPMVERLFDDEALETLGATMQETQDELLRKGNPRNAIPDEIGAAAPL
jgi:hemerythrin superfamily protein